MKDLKYTWMTLHHTEMSSIQHWIHWKNSYNAAKIQIILLIPTPTTQTEVRSFLGFSGYYRKFIEHFLHIATPLYALTGNVDFLWTEKCERAF